MSLLIHTPPEMILSPEPIPPGKKQLTRKWAFQKQRSLLLAGSRFLPGLYFLATLLFLSGMVSCTSSPKGEVRDAGLLPQVFPDLQGVTIPPDIAPLNFRVAGEWEEMILEVKGRGGSFSQRFRGPKTRMDRKKWADLLLSSSGDSLYMQVSARQGNTWSRFRPLSLFIARDPVDDYLVYRLVMPGYQTWNVMGIYQRELATFREETLADSRLLPGTCMNCHSFPQNDPSRMILHLRENNGGTILLEEGQPRKINTRSEKTFAAAAFPYWHPSRRYAAFSVNRITQIFHASGPVRAHALDMRSDILLYDMEKNELFTSPLLQSGEAFETFPCFSPDGKTLLFATAPAGNLPDDQTRMKYSLCAVSFDPVTGKTGEHADTLVSAPLTGKSVTIPRYSPDGKFIMVCRCDYGSFPAYNPESDLWMVQPATGAFYPLDALNSPDVESYHSWSSNGRWVVFSSRRMDGLFSNAYIGYIDENGQPRKPFLLPQEDPDFHQTFLFSYNIPEFVTGKVKLDPFDLERVARRPAGDPVTFDTSH